MTTKIIRLTIAATAIIMATARITSITTNNHNDNNTNSDNNDDNVKNTKTTVALF